MHRLLFGAFELDPASGELWRRGRLVALGPQPTRLLCLLASRPRQLISREEIQQHLWADGTSVDFEHGVNACIRQVRHALGDRAARPRYIETVARRGYRFKAAVLAPPGARTKQAGQIVGREDVFEGLSRVYERIVSHGRGGIACLSGEPGIGKTTVANAFLSRLARHPTAPVVGRGRCSERLAAVTAYLPWLEALDELTAGPSSDGARALLRAAAPAWHQLVASAADQTGADGRSGPESAEQLKRQLAAFLGRLASGRPAIIWFEDLHWADTSTIDLIAYLASRFDDMRLLLLVTFRETELRVSRHPFAALRLELVSKGLCQSVPLPFLALNDVQAYLDAEFPGHAFPPSLAASLHSRTEGNPLFVVDAAAYLRARGVIVLDEGRWRLRGALEDHESDLPPSITAMIERKLGLVHEAADLDVLQAACVLDHDFASTIVSDMLDRDPAEVETSLDRLERVHGLVTATGHHRLPDGTPTMGHRFVHVLYQNALAAGMAPTRRARLCRTAGGALRERYRDQCGPVFPSLARLYEEAGDAPRAAEFSVMAARRALQLFANHEVVRLAESGLRLLAGIADTRERETRELELRLTLSPALTALHGWAGETLRDNYVRSYELAERVADRRDVLHVLLGLARFHHVRANFAECERLARRVLSMVARTNDPLLPGMAHGSLGAAAFHRARLTKARSHLTEQLDLYDPAVHPQLLHKLSGMDTAAVALGYLACIEALEGRDATAAARLDRALEYAGTHPFTCACIPAFGSVVGLVLDRPDMVERFARDTVRVSHEHGFMGQAAFGTFFQGWAAAAKGHDEEGVRAMDEAEQVLTVVGNDLFLSARQLALAEIHHRAGRRQAAVGALHQMEDFINRTGERIFEPELYRLRGRMAVSDRDFAGAWAELERARTTARELGTSLFEARADEMLASVRRH